MNGQTNQQTSKLTTDHPAEILMAKGRVDCNIKEEAHTTE